MEFVAFNQDEELSQRRGLFDDAFPENKGSSAASIEHYQWKFHRAPFTPPSYEYVAIDDDKMLGYYAAVPYPYQIGDRRIFAGMVCDVMTHSQARGKGVFADRQVFASRDARHQPELSHRLSDPPGCNGWPPKGRLAGGL